ncbi:MAG: tetratricopeptide repeat protein, partial [Bacteroidia bacterium]
MGKKVGLVFIVIIAIHGFLCAQKRVDSLLKITQTAKEDSTRIQAYLNLSAYFKNSNLQKSIEYSYLALKKSTTINESNFIGLSYNSIAETYFRNEKYDSALKYYYKALDFITPQVNLSYYNIIHKKIGTIYFYTENYANSLEHYLINLKVAEQQNNPEQISAALSNIGNIYKEQGKLDEAYSYFTKAIKNCTKHNDYKVLSIAQINMGNLQSGRYKKTNNTAYLDSSLYYYFEAQKFIGHLADSGALAMLYCNIGNGFTDKKQYDTAIIYYDKAIAIRNRIQEYSQMAVIYQDIASCYIEMGDFSKAKKYLDLGVNYAKENNALGDLSELYEEFAAFYEKQNDYKRAYQYEILHKQYADSIFNEEGIEKRKELEMNFSFEKEREKQKAEEEKKEVLRKEEKKRSAWYVGISICGIFVSIFIALIIYRNFKRTQKAHIIISKQKNEIEIQKHFVEEKNKEVMDSIHYAKRIQGAVFTSENYIKKYVNDFFILYKPKDIVSGDFYWALNLNNKFYLATADCTGHGVPGAFMSLLNISFLNEV